MVINPKFLLFFLKNLQKKLDKGQEWLYNRDKLLNIKGGGEDMANMLCGIYEHQLDDKGRLRIPAKFNKGLTG